MSGFYNSTKMGFDETYTKFLNDARYDLMEGNGTHSGFFFAQDFVLVGHLRTFYESEGYDFKVNDNLEGGGIWCITVSRKE